MDLSLERTNHGPGNEFGAHRIHEDGTGTVIQEIPEEHGIKPILARVKHPQTTGKLER